MNCMNSSFDTVPSLSLSIMRTSIRTSLSAVPAVRLLAARAALEIVLTTNAVVINAIALRVVEGSPPLEFAVGPLEGGGPFLIRPPLKDFRLKGNVRARPL
jgi:hypothetical protein